MMFKSRNHHFLHRKFLLTILGVVTLLSLSCSSQEKRARQAVEDYLKPYGAREVKLEAFHTSKDFPDKAYISVQVTWNYADSHGGYDTQHSGYILRREGDGWAIVKQAAYTTSEQKARDYLAGLK